MSGSIFRRAVPGSVARRSLWFLALASATPGYCAAAGPASPNVVVITTDDLGYNELGFTAALTGQTTQFETPNLDALAQQSVVARQGYTAFSLCSSSRAGLLTGQYPQRFGFESQLSISPFPVSSDTDGFTANEVTIASHLKGLGYSTGMIGKWHTGYVDGVNVPLDKGFDEFFGTWSGARHYFFDSRPANQIRRGDDIYETEYRAGGNPAEYDPINGRYVTDAFGDEAAAFVKNHANEANPFFLYAAFTAPHDPFETKQQDLNHFAHIADITDRKQAAMVYAMDRSVGKVLGALDDPNGDGNMSDSIRNNTIIVFTNDNGGTTASDNSPFRGGKGFSWEGSIRVPFIISAPGVQPGVYDAPIIAYDILPTAYAAAGGDVSQLDSDGVDLLPYLSGSNPDDPHEILFWRNKIFWAVRKGDWKLGTPDGANVMSLFNLATDPGETNNVAAQNPELVAELVRELTHWEAQLKKPRWFDVPTAGSTVDHFVFRSDTFGGGGFSSTSLWKDAATGALATLGRCDGYANAILEFPTKTGSFGLLNNMVRGTGQLFMINELRFTGNFTGTFNSGGAISGEPFLLVKNLNGGSARIRLDATSTGTPLRFRFDVNTPLQILDDLEISGDGTQNFFINGNLQEFDLPKNVTKSGTSKVTLTGTTSIRGNFAVTGGEVQLSGANAAINGANSLLIGAAGTFILDGGLLATPLVDHSGGGSFQFTGGELRTANFLGDLINQGGSFSPGASPALGWVSGNFKQTGGSLTVELGGTTPGAEFDQLLVGGQVVLGGELHVKLVNDYVPSGANSFEFLLGNGGITGTFTNIVLPELGPTFAWQVVYDPTSVRLLVEQSPNPLAGDYNFNGVVDAADYVVWRNTLGSTSNLAADGDGDGIIDSDDYELWRARLGNTSPPPAHGVLTGVPEPSTLALGALLLFAALNHVRRRAKRTGGLL